MQADRQFITTAARVVFILPPIYQSHSQLSLKGHGNLGNVPEDWQKAIITAFFKKGKQQDGRTIDWQPHLSAQKRDGASNPTKNFEICYEQEEN